MKKASTFRFKEYIRETCAENIRKGNFIRIYPSKGSDMYDSLFLGPRPYNKVVYKALYSEEVIRFNLNPQGNQIAPDSKLKMEMPANSYE